MENCPSVSDEPPVLVWRSGQDGRCEYVNRAWLQFTGRALEQELGEGWLVNVHPEDRGACRAAFHSAVHSHSAFQVDYRLRRHDGEYRWLQASGAPRFISDAKYAGHVVASTDLTGRKLAERAVRRHLALLKHARDAMLLLGPAGEIRDVNEAAEKMYGFSRSQLLGRNIADLRAPEPGGTPSPADVERATRNGHLSEAVHQRADGSHFDAEVSSQAALVDGERMIVSIVRDVSERHRIEQQLRASEARYRSLFENMREGVAIQKLVCKDGEIVDYRILDVNPAFLSHTGSRPQAFIGRLATEAFSTQTPPYLDHYRRLVASGQPVSFESYFAPFNRHYVISAFWMGGLQFATIFTDVTERKRVEEQFRQSQKMEAVGRLAGGIAHDFNNLLTIILAYTDMLLEAVNDDALRAGIESINDAGERAAKLTSQLLTFSRKQVIQPRALDLNQIVAETGDMVRRIIGEDIELEIMPGESLRAILGDPGQIEQVILNLVVNARDAMPKGGRLTIETANVSIQGTAETGAIPPGGYVLLSVADTGVGMSADVRSHLFEPFFTTKPVGRGTGLGLSTVYGIVKQCGGELMVESEVGEGARFDIYLPAVANGNAPEKRTRGSVERSAGGETILVVEDEAHVRRLVGQLLHGLGYKVISAGTAQEALAPLENPEERIHLMLTDVVMPGMSGPELASSARTIRPGMPVLFMSGYPDVSITHRGMEVAPDAFVQKPFTADVLSAKIRQLLEKD